MTQPHTLDTHKLTNFERHCNIVQHTQHTVTQQRTTDSHKLTHFDRHYHTVEQTWRTVHAHFVLTNSSPWTNTTTQHNKLNMSWHSHTLFDPRWQTLSCSRANSMYCACTLFAHKFLTFDRHYNVVQQTEDVMKQQCTLYTHKLPHSRANSMYCAYTLYAHKFVTFDRHYHAVPTNWTHHETTAHTLHTHKLTPFDRHYHDVLLQQTQHIMTQQRTLFTHWNSPPLTDTPMQYNKLNRHYNVTNTNLTFTNPLTVWGTTHSKTNSRYFHCIHKLYGSWDSLLVRATDAWSKGCEFESWQERRENFLLQSQLCVLTLIWCSFHPYVTAEACKRPWSFHRKCRWQKHAYTLDPMKLEWADYTAIQALCGNLSGNKLTCNSSENTRSQSSQLAKPLWTDSGLKSGITVCTLISTKKKKCRWEMNCQIFPQNPRTRGKSHHNTLQLHAHTLHTQTLSPWPEHSSIHFTSKISLTFWHNTTHLTITAFLIQHTAYSKNP